MGKLRQRVTPTFVGDVAYKTVDCDSCHQETILEDAHFYVTGNLQTEKDWTVLGKIEYEFDRDCNTGYICSFCADEDGLLGLGVSPRYTLVLNEITGMLAVLGILAVVMVLLAL